MSEKYIIPVFVPHLGCPNNCTFCNQKSISGQMKNITPEEVKNIIETFLKSFKDENIEREIAFFGGSFTGIESKIQEELLEIAYQYVKDKKVTGIRVSTRPDYIDKEKLKLLKKYGVKTIELGVQSTNDYILKKCKRGHTFEDVKNASKLIRRKRFVLGHQMMVGLPESTEIDDINTAKDLIKLKPKIVRIYPVLVIKGTELARMYSKGDYIPLTVEQAVERCKTLTYMFRKNNINVIRIGLQNTSEINSPEADGSEVLAGPFHPAFRQLVESAMWYDAISAKMKDINYKVKQIEIEVNPININEVIGHKKENVNKLKKIYELDTVVTPNEQIKPGDFKINVLETY